MESEPLPLNSRLETTIELVRRSEAVGGGPKHRHYRSLTSSQEASEAIHKVDAKFGCFVAWEKIPFMQDLEI